MFSRDYKTVLAHATSIAEKIATTLDDNGFVDAPHNLRKLLPLVNRENIDAALKLLPALRVKLFERTRSASGMGEGEVICLSYISELYGVLLALFVLPTIERPDTDTLFPVEVSDGLRKLDLD